ncbi:hypothetical protein RvY_14285 [Ramazzottius varieornatus]|uniref:Uncharacterized protein n=1 Tax=Ramazzottius varieornatus TaxID=947166 RepID=A0A1D1VSH0_RAMVA|nr:hypothetical protein RvY_14285 [Ramazzottius varieornatus]
MDNSIAVANVLTVKALSGVTFLALAKLVEPSSWEAAIDAMFLKLFAATYEVFSTTS